MDNVRRVPEHNIACRYRFTCGAKSCPGIEVTGKKPECYVDKFERYQPEIVWHHRDWEEINRITWRDVLSLKESWIYSLIIIIVAVFIFLLMILIYVIIKIKRYY